MYVAANKKLWHAGAEADSFSGGTGAGWGLLIGIGFEDRFRVTGHRQRFLAGSLGFRLDFDENKSNSRNDPYSGAITMAPFLYL